MYEIQIPYDKKYKEFKIETKNLKSIIRKNEDRENKKVTLSRQVEIIRKSLQNPIDSKPLSEISKDKDKILIVTSDHTRSVPSKITLPIVISEIKKGNPEAKIKIIIATGLHRATTKEEQRSMFGDEIVDNIQIKVHDAFAKEDLQFVCNLPSGSSFTVNKLALEADMIFCEGFIEPHFFAGFSGGRKSILPGICGAETINENHSYKAIAHKNSRTGVLNNNVIHEDMIFAANKIGVDFILNVALNESKEVVASFAGHLDKAHKVGCDYVYKNSKKDVIKGNIVITGNGGYPLDQNLYQCVKSVDTASNCLEEGGVLILVASCKDGLGDTHFNDLIKMESPLMIQEKLKKISPKETIPEQWSAQVFSKIMLNHKIILVTDYLSKDQVKDINMIHAKTGNEALNIAYKLLGEKKPSVIAIPDGVSVIF